MWRSSYAVVTLVEALKEGTVIKMRRWQIYKSTSLSKFLSILDLNELAQQFLFANSDLALLYFTTQTKAIIFRCGGVWVLLSAHFRTILGSELHAMGGKVG